MASLLHGLVYFYRIISCPCIDGVSGPGQHAQARSYLRRIFQH